jgi:V-type H+-transporting ATPase proteolipid subunit
MLPPDFLISIGIALSSGLSGIGASIGLAIAGQAMAGAGAEKPEVLSKALISIVLAEAIAIYGLLSSFMLVGKLGTIATEEVAFMGLVAGVVVGVSGLAAGVGIGYMGAAMSSAMAEKPETFSKNVVGVVLAEAIAIYGLLVSFMIIARMV